MDTIKSKIDSLNKRLTYHEKIPAIIFDESNKASAAMAHEIAGLIRNRNKNEKKTVLGLATGSTPVKVYEELIRIHKEEGLSFKNVITFNLDEYYPMDPGSLQSYVRFMHEHLFDHVDIPKNQIHIPDGTIFKADRIFLLAWGEGKAPIIKETMEGEIKESVPAAYLQNHPNTTIVLDEAAAEKLTRVNTPWLLTKCDWTDKLIRKAVVWLCLKLNKPILKLSDENYNENGMADLITKRGPAYNINIKTFNELQHTITGWPGGKPNEDDKYRPERATPFPKRCLIFSPHPDDDVISMGGTLIRLVDHGHEVHIAYQTSGNKNH
jgi:6-phosphogluconolactonase/glucosamine-6-phosphate isomerase/deaminase